LHFVGEKKQVTFTEIKKGFQVEDSSSLFYHLGSLAFFIAQKNEKYLLSDLGQEAYNLIVKTNVYASNSIFLRLFKKATVILDNCECAALGGSSFSAITI
jgi:hypothetical protein